MASAEDRSSIGLQSAPFLDKESLNKQRSINSIKLDRTSSLGSSLMAEVDHKLQTEPLSMSSRQVMLTETENMMSSLEPDDDSIPSYIILYRPMIEMCVDCLPLLPQMRDIFDDPDERHKIQRAEREEGKRVATEMFLKRLETKSGFPDRWRRFVQALKQADYQYVSKTLEKEELINTQIFTTQRKLIDLFAHELCKKLKPTEICVDLFAKKVINKTYFDAIRLEERNHGEEAATIVLIDNIWRCHKNWYQIFLDVLWDKNYKDVVRKIDDFYEEKRFGEDKESTAQVHSDLHPKRDTMAPSDKFGAENQEKNIGAFKKQISYSKFVDGKEDVKEKDELEPTKENYLSETFDGQESVNNLSGQSMPESLDEEFERFSLHDTDAVQQETRQKHIMSLDPMAESTVDNADFGPSGLNSMAVRNMFDSLDREVETTNNRPNIIGSNPVPSIGENADKLDLSDSDDDDETMNKEELVLRSYQEELARPALQGLNCIIVAPTGSGKTHVALRIIKNHMEQMKGRRIAKVIFLVEQSALAEQQGKQCKTYLPCTVKVITGESQRGERLKTLKEWISRRDLLVVTAQILVNALKEGTVNITDFSLMVFDECHHTNDKHSYNRAMNHYLDIKLENAESRQHLPMIVGLTASVGVGRARTDEGAKHHIEKVMANMDARDISVVVQHREELAQHVNIPKHKVYPVKKREKNYFGEILEKLMSATEKYMKQSKYEQHVKEPEKVLKAPTEKGTDQYTQWVSALWRETSKIPDQSAGRFYDTCRKYLALYNKALIIYKDARPTDALNFIMGELKKWEETLIPDETDEKMKRWFDKSKELLQKSTLDPKHKNPKLDALRRMIRDYFKENPDSRAIIFVKTRELVRAIEAYMKETEGLFQYNPVQFVGTQAAKEKGGMTKVEQDEILRLFKEGNHKIIISTSVAEEGLDIQKCSLVVRYDHVTNEIAMVQSRGRGRAEDSKYIILASEESGTIEKEELNQIRESMMNKAILSVKEDLTNKQTEVLKRIQQLQETAKLERDIAAQSRKAAQANMGEFKLTCKTCRKFICMSTDVRKIEDAHHAAINEDIRDSILAKRIPTPAFEGVDLTTGAGKLFCKGCGNPLGNISIYKSAQFCILKCEFFVIVDTVGNGVTKKKWKQVPFDVPPLSATDISRRLQGQKFIDAY